MKAKIIILFLIFTFIITSGFGCKGAPKEVKEAMEPVALEYWRVWDGPDAFSDIIGAYQALHPYVDINYRKLRYSEYEKELINALAEDRAPDIISIHNTWIKKYEDKIIPIPPKTTMAYTAVKGTIKQEVFYELRTKNSLTPKNIRNDYIDTVLGDIIVNEKILGLPLSVDTLVMFYNKDLFNNAGIINPPEYWNKDFQQYVKQLTKLDTSGNIIQSGVALGGSSNIERSTDILSVLMMQNGATMINDGAVAFNSIPPIYSSINFNPGLEALRFYTDFASPTKEVYSWSNELDNSIDMFAKGKLAMMFGYSYHIPTIKAKGPKINFAISPLPQIEGNLQKVNFANYWVETVLKKSKNPEVAWDFLQFVAQTENVKSFLEKTNRPTALRSQIEEQIADEEIGIFANQLLTAKSWYKGKGANTMEDVMKEMIDQVVSNPQNIGNAMSSAVGKIQQTIR